MGPVNLTDLIGPPLSAKDVGADQETVKPLIDVAEVKRQVDAAIVSDVTDISWSEMTGADLNIPPFLKRTQADVDKLKAERKLKEAAAKKAMPLTGRAALAAIKAPPKKRRTA
jgi:pyruvate/2-oxoglutarate dehydrogenase complex dihydrolipoamide acyltransferase (E2) component